jgi:spore germination protein KA
MVTLRVQGGISLSGWKRDFKWNTGKRSKEWNIAWKEPDRDVSPDLDETLSHLSSVWERCHDLQTRHVNAGGNRLLIAWLGTMVDKQLLHEDIVEPLTRADQRIVSKEQLGNILQVGSLQWKTVWRDVNVCLAAGQTAVFAEGIAEAAVVDLVNMPGRQIERPIVEAAVLGPQEAFIEDIEQNISLIRKRIKSPRLKMEMENRGTVTRTRIALLYVEGIIKQDIVAEVKQRLKDVKLDGIMDSNYVAEFIRDAPRTIFPTVQFSERPDVIASSLLQGRAVLLVEGSPFSLLVPTTLFSMLQSSEDYYENYLVATFIRMLRHILFWISILLPSLYVALLSFHQEMVPSQLLFTIAASHEGIPFPAVVEVLIMEVFFEALREAGLRLPRSIGQSVSIVGALVIGDAAVTAGLVSPLVVMIVALTGIASFSVPYYQLGLAPRILRFAFVIDAGFLGLYGVVLMVLILLIHLASIRSFGVPYLAPITPFVWSQAGDHKDMFFRAPFRKMKKRPRLYEPVDK